MNLLKDINKHSKDKRLQFFESNHRYIIDDEIFNVISVTSLISSLFEPFNKEKIINFIINNNRHKNDELYEYYNKTKEEILEQWNNNSLETSKLGTILHNDIEIYLNDKNIDNIINKSNEKNEYKYLLNFLKEEEIFIKKIYRTEWSIFSRKYRLAGTIDALFKNDDDTYTIYDWKRTKEIKFDFTNSLTKSNKNNMLLNIKNVNFNIYSLQLNLYKYILENFYNMKVKDMFLIIFYPLNGNYLKYEVNDCKNIIKIILDERKKQLNNN